MGHFLRPGEFLLTPDGPRQVVSPGTDTGHVSLLDQSTNTVTTVTVAALRKLIASGQYARAVKHLNTGKVTALTMSESAQRKLSYNVEVVRRIESEMRAGMSIAEAYRLHADDTIETTGGISKPICSLRQVQRLIKSARSGALELTPAYSARGNRTRRYHEELLNLILTLAEDHYSVTHSRLRIRTLTNLVNESAGSLLPEGKAISRGYVKQVLIQHWHPDRDYRRLDHRVARSAKAVAKNRIKVEGALHRVEQDTLNLPFVVMTSFGIADELNLMLALDCATGMPMAWRLVARKVTGEDTLKCLEMGMTPKESLFKQLEIRCDIDPYGTYLQLHIDNGAENVGERIDNLAKFGIDVTRTPAYSGHLKPFIERLNRSLKEALEALPGSTRFEGKDGARSEAARSDQLMTIEQLERWIVRWLYEKWIHTPLERFITADYELSKVLGLTPAERWRGSEAQYPLPLPPPPGMWMEIMYEEATPVLSRKTGVSINGFRFRGDNLVILVNQYGDGTKISVRFNPSDYRFVYAFDKHTQQPLVLNNAEVTPESPAYSFGEARQRRKKVRDSVVKPQVAKDFDRELAHASMSFPMSARSRRQSKKEMSTTVKDQDALERARDTPVPRAAENTQVEDSAQAYVTPDSVPVFATVSKPRKRS